ncbi:MAG: ATP-grasp domain-containing protein [Dongiaceae bacterium]
MAPPRDRAADAARPLLVLALAMSPAEQAALARIGGAERFRLQPFGDPAEVGDPAFCRPGRLVPALVAAAGALPEPAAGVIAFDDYPASPLGVALAERLGLPGPRLDASLLCHHKYWSRLRQREVAPEAVPAFAPVDLARPPATPPLPFPFWLKPVKSSLSHLGFRIESAEAYAAALARAAAELPAYVAAFDELLALAPGLPPAGYPALGGRALIAEALIGGRQVTLEAFVQGGAMRLMGITDSVCFPGHPSFSRFVYPSALPGPVQARMAAVAGRVMAGFGFADGLFSIEFFYDEPQDRIWLIEINPRYCPQFADLYAMVDGLSSHQVMIELACGLTPRLRPGAGRCRVAASFVWRRFSDATVVGAPGPDDLERLREALPDAHVDFLARPGDRLSELAQDAYSFRYAVVNIGAADAAALESGYRRAAALLPFRFAPPGLPPAPGRSLSGREVC